MTVSARTRTVFLPFRSAGGAFPAGIWTSQLLAIGDASGGDILLIHEVFTLTEPFSALLLTLEQVQLDIDQNAPAEWLFQAVGFEEHNPVGNNNITIAFNTVASIGNVSAQAPGDLLRKPLFLGRCDRTSGQASEISLRSANNDLNAFRDALYGYYWGPEAMNAPGGPQRPPGSLFGN